MLSSIAFINSSKPCLVLVEMIIASLLFVSYSYSIKSHLLKTYKIGIEFASIVFNVSTVTSNCKSLSLLEISLTNKIKSASSASSKVERKALIRVVGSLLIKPTVSQIKNSLLLFNLILVVMVLDQWRGERKSSWNRAKV